MEVPPVPFRDGMMNATTSNAQLYPGVRFMPVGGLVNLGSNAAR